jgi:REP element-mobilizing transposase RayT
MRKAAFVNGEFYHVYNRGVDKRDIFQDKLDFERFFQSMDEFNVLSPIGSIYENSFIKEKNRENKLITFAAYCINPNHYHFLIKQTAKNGIEKFMHRLGTGYTKYFNNKYKRNGALFQGNFKAVHVDSNEYLLHLSSYINLNHEVHKIEAGQFSKSSWDEFVKNIHGICENNIILQQFENPLEYKEYAKNSLKDIIERKKMKKELEDLLIEE